MHITGASSPIRDDDPVSPIYVDPKDFLINRNGLANNQFVFTMARIRNMPYFVTATAIPGISLGEGNVPSPHRDWPAPGDKIIFEPLVLRFKVQEDLANFLEMQRWMRGIAKPEGFDERKALERGWDGYDTTDCGLSIPTNAENLEGFYVHFKNCWPTSLEALEFDVSDGQGQLFSTVTLNYSTYTIHAVPDHEPQD